MYDVIVVGDGVIALSIAVAIKSADPTVNIAIMGSGDHQHAATMAAGAMLNCFGELEHGILQNETLKYKFELSKFASTMWPAWAAELGVNLEPVGTLVVKNRNVHGPDFDAICQALKEYKQPHRRGGVQHSWVAGKLEAEDSVHIRNEHAIDPSVLMTALLKRADDLGIGRIWENASRIRRDGPNYFVESDNLVRYNGGKIVVAAGASTGKIVEDPAMIRLFYGVGVSLLLGTRHVPECIVRTPNRGMSCGIHAVPRGPNRVYIGSSNYVSADPQASAKAGTIAHLIEGAVHEINRNYSDARLLSHSVGWRPISADGLPMVGPTSFKNVLVCTGTKRDGLHMSPFYAFDMSDRILLGKPLIGEKFAPLRSPSAYLSRQEGISMAVKAAMTAQRQHDNLTLSFDHMAVMEQGWTAHYSEVYDRLGLTHGVMPELIPMYEQGLIKPVWQLP